MKRLTRLLEPVVSAIAITLVTPNLPPLTVTATPRSNVTTLILPTYQGKCDLQKVFPPSERAVPLDSKRVKHKGTWVCRVTILEIPLKEA